MVYDAVPIDDVFERRYELEWLYDMPSAPSIERYIFGSAGGPILRITPRNGKQFVATVGGDASSLKLLSWPNPNAFATTVQPWLIDAASASDSRELRGFEGHTLHYTFPVPDRGLILLGHCCGIYCYDSRGLAWMRDDLFCCDDPELSVQGDVLTVVGRLHGEDEHAVKKSVDLLSGATLKN